MMAPEKAILVVDDEEQIQVVLRQILKLDHYLVTAAHTGAQAMELLAQNHDFRLILLDLTLPDCRGLELASRIVEKTVSRIPILLISGNPELSEMKLPPGVVGAVGKPFDFAELLRLVRQSIENSSSH
ncbi:MAG: response regulator [Bdellovibrionota bacterium]